MRVSALLSRFAGIVALLAIAAWPALSNPAPAFGATFTVNTASDLADVSPGNGVCVTATATCSLRAAIEETNALPGADVINFAIGAGPVTISPPPDINDTVTIDGTTQGGYAGVPLIQTSGAPFAQFIFRPGADNSVLRGIAITGGTTAGVLIEADNVTVERNYIGTLDGLTPASNYHGVSLLFVQGGMIGSTTPGNGNLISGNIFKQVSVSGASGVTIVGNYIGTNASGSAVMDLSPEELVPWGVWVDGSSADIQIGSALAGGRNVISGHQLNVSLVDSPGATVQGNYIGTNAAGTESLVLTNNSIGIDGSGADAVIGGAGPGEGNLIGGNNYAGIRWYGPDVEIYGNRIGTNATGSGYMPNGVGVFLTGNGGRVGGAAAGQGNIIRTNNKEGVLMSAAAGTSFGNTIRGNSMVSNQGAAIDLSTSTSVGDGGTANDPLDADTGPNTLQNYPVPTAASVTGGTNIAIAGILQSTPSTLFTLDFYADETCAFAGQVRGQGYRYIGASTTTTNNAGDAVFNAALTGFAGGRYVTATATDPAGNTSEFSFCNVQITSCENDSECDGHLDVALSAHTGPVNTNVAFDNCLNGYNPDQENADANFTELGPAKLYDDRTLPMSDAIGNPCDTDADNDGIPNLSETGFGPCGATNLYDADTDDDRALDGAECTIGTNPRDPASSPTPAQCAIGAGVPASTDADGDNIFAWREYCYYGTSDTSTNSDGDACSDGKEMASINADNTVNAIDIAQVAGMFGLYLVTAPDIHVRNNADMTKDGVINASDLSQVAQRFDPC